MDKEISYEHSSEGTNSNGSTAGTILCMTKHPEIAEIVTGKQSVGPANSLARHVEKVAPGNYHSQDQLDSKDTICFENSKLTKQTNKNHLFERTDRP